MPPAAFNAAGGISFLHKHDKHIVHNARLIRADWLKTVKATIANRLFM